MYDLPRIDATSGPRPHAYDPVAHPEYFEGVLARRLVAFVVDTIIIAAPLVVLGLFILVIGVLTLGLGWLLYGLMWPAAVIWVILYVGLTLGSTASATIGMRMVGLELRTWYGSPMYFLLAAVHAIFFWVSVSVLTPLVLVIGLFNNRGRLLHDFLTGTVMVNNEARAASLRPHLVPGAKPL